MWLIAIVGVCEVGSSHFWVVCVNLIAAFVTRKILASKRPLEYDPRLRQTTDLAAESYGCSMNCVAEFAVC